VGPIQPVLERLDPLLAPVALTPTEYNDLVHFVRDALLDPRATQTCSIIPKGVPSGLPLPKFEGCGSNSENK
jgi:hypothetical protein